MTSVVLLHGRNGEMALKTAETSVASGLERALPEPLTRLTKKERQLLAILVQNSGKCVSRELLLRTVWNYSQRARTRTVDVHIQRLRRKLPPEAASCLRTIVGSGYCWFPEFHEL